MDKRKMGCPNKKCEMNMKKKKISVTERICPLCGATLSLVCNKCFSPIEDMGEKHSICTTCEAKKVDIKNNWKKGGTIGFGIVAGLVAAAGGAVEIKKKIKKK